ncbi:S66 peptidase family protein [Aequorivita antarctica]|uniref:LD-carboxypeptidase n=1 Tax=Aequorivita antarctica TaxID=153266 RepID=A0A5C6Z418_9FLAO|nr:LD-carboxypeptidase [Aequorivita antarctica]TXD74827.1 LD-carboxypeptidase [Aequorivita antarctica]SRX72469.1 putative murein peptide carboxypeptidase [Aequorivita antarctica]
MLTPPFLHKGDTVAIVSTARKISEKELQPALKLIENWGLKAIIGDTIEAEENQFAGSDDLRASDFQQMLDNPNIKAIWCARGGYGTVRIIDKLNFSTFKKYPKWIIGYSDVTVLHSHIHNFGIETLHAQMCLEIENKSPETTESIRKALFGEDYSIEISHKDYFASSGIYSGELIGGNLSVLYSLCGSASEMETDGKILFIEDLDEMLYHIDRMMINLKRSGYLKNLKALVIGGMTQMKDNKVYFGKTAEEIIMELVKDYNYPVILNFPSGHIPDNRALIFGREIKIDIQPSKIKFQF